MAARLEDMKVNIKLKLSALWITTLFIFAYVDIFAFFRRDIIEGVMDGKVSNIQIDQLFLFFTTVYVLIPSLMVFLSLVLKPEINRWANIIVAILYLITIVASCIGVTWAYYLFGSVVESLLLLLIIWFAWKWPTEAASTQ